MSTRVIFLGDSSIEAQSWLSHLQALSYEVVCPKTAHEAMMAIELDNAKAIVRVAEPPHSAAATCQQLKQEYPQMPVLHMMRAGRPVPVTMQTPFHDYMPTEASREEFARRLGNLIFFSNMRRELVDLKDLQSKTTAFAESIAKLDMNAILDEALPYFGTELECENVLWFPEGVLEKEIDRYLSKGDPMAKEKAPQDENILPFPMTRGRVRSWKEMKGEDSAQVLSEWMMEPMAASIDSGKRFEISGPNEAYVVMPIQATGEMESCFGHMVMMNPKKWAPLKDSEWMEQSTRILTAQMNQAMAHNLVQNMTFKDDLTDLYNQRYLPVILEQEFNRATRSEHQFSVLFLDVDFFKMVNDTKGHMVGSSVLVELSKLFKNSIRTTDFAFRYGGDEYVIVLSGANSQNAVRVAERLRKKTADSVFSINGTQVRITVSIGIATFPEHAKSTTELLNMADEAMYYGKNKSRNVVYMAS